jgi:hypothetical protein
MGELILPRVTVAAPTVYLADWAKESLATAFLPSQGRAGSEMSSVERAAAVEHLNSQVGTGG